MAGGDITRFASLHPERPRAVVYLDAAYDLTAQAPSADALPKDPATPDDMRSIRQYIKYLARITRAVFPEADVRATVVMDADGRVLRRETPPAVWKAMEAADQRPAWANVRVPALAICAATDARSLFPNYDKLGPGDRKPVDDLAVAPASTWMRTPAASAARPPTRPWSDSPPARTTSSSPMPMKCGGSFATSSTASDHTWWTGMAFRAKLLIPQPRPAVSDVAKSLRLSGIVPVPIPPGRSP